MQTIRTFVLVSAVFIAAVAASFGGCGRKAEPAKPAAEIRTPAKSEDHSHKNGDGHDDGPTTQLGERIVGGFTVRASRDGGITPGKDAPIDVWVTGGSAAVAAVRFWIGAEDGRGSVKAKAELEKDNWHTHAEIPNPMPPGSRLWVEIESDKGERTLVAFDLML